METLNPGSEIRLRDAVEGATVVLVARLVGHGQPSPGPPGAAHIVGATIDIEQALTASGVGSPPARRARVSYIQQTMPANRAEAPLEQGRRYLFFCADTGESGLQALKVLPHTEENQRTTVAALGAAPAGRGLVASERAPELDAITSPMEAIPHPTFTRPLGSDEQIAFRATAEILTDSQDAPLVFDFPTDRFTAELGLASDAGIRTIRLRVDAEWPEGSATCGASIVWQWVVRVDGGSVTVSGPVMETSARTGRRFRLHPDSTGVLPTHFGNSTAIAGALLSFVQGTLSLVGETQRFRYGFQVMLQAMTPSSGQPRAWLRTDVADPPLPSAQMLRGASPFVLLGRGAAFRHSSERSVRLRAAGIAHGRAPVPFAPPSTSLELPIDASGGTFWLLVGAYGAGDTIQAVTCWEARYFGMDRGSRAVPAFWFREIFSESHGRELFIDTGDTAIPAERNPGETRFVGTVSVRARGEGDAFDARAAFQLLPTAGPGTQPATTTTTPATRARAQSESAASDMADEYRRLYAGCVIAPSHLAEVDRIVARIGTNRARYEALAATVGVPWYVIATIHSLEADLRFSTHLHNGDPLTARTVHEPAGRPPGGSPPFTWEQSADDALRMHRLNTWTDWSVAGVLGRLERYNGLGYRHVQPTINSPYLWSYTNQYTRGKFVSDGVYDANAVSEQCGGAALLLRMEQTSMISPLTPPPPGR